MPSLAGLAGNPRSARTDGHRSTAYPPRRRARGHGYLRRPGTRRLCVDRRTARRPASTVFQRLLAQPYRVLVINAHGVFGKRAVDGSYRSGVVLSDGLLLSAAEISLMESVPDLVFLNCCHLARSGVGGNGNRLAAGLSRKLIEMGVRCVVAAGWEVRDDAAQTFAETFFERMAVRGEPFGEAIFQARNATLAAHHDCNTWGAYQAYGDPSFRLTTKTLPAAG